MTGYVYVFQRKTVKGLKMKVRIKQIIACMLILSVVVAIAACGGKKEKIDEVEANGTSVKEYTDDCGRKVTFTEEITRIVASGPLSEMIVYALAPDYLVASTQRNNKVMSEYLDEEYLKLPYLGSLYESADINVEELALSDPQLIVDIGEAKKSLPEDMDALMKQTGIPSVHLEATLETLPEMYRKLGRILGREEKAEQLALFCENVYGRTLEIMDKVGQNKVKALYVLGDEGLNVLAKGSYHAEIVDMLTDNLAVVENPSGKGLGNEVGMEQIALWNPDFIIFAPGSIFSKAADMDNWKNLKAIKSGNYIEIPQGPYNWMGNPPSVQRILALIWLPSILYPEYCDYDVKAKIKEYYKLFYGFELSDAQYEVLVKNGK